MAVIAATVACSSAPPMSDATFPEGALATLPSDGGGARVEVRTSPAQPPSRGVTNVKLTISDVAGAPLDGLRVKVVPWMPAMGHGASVLPTVTPLGHGEYVVHDVDMFMPGHWELRAEIAGALEDHVTPTFQIP